MEEGPASLVNVRKKLVNHGTKLPLSTAEVGLFEPSAVYLGNGLKPVTPGNTSITYPTGWELGPLYQPSFSTAFPVFRQDPKQRSHTTSAPTKKWSATKSGKISTQFFRKIC